ncbi:MAG: ABC transporter permease [Actinobacteria bacterium]|nr:ABC transporter permease [Actinomycetota bacterium]
MLWLVPTVVFVTFLVYVAIRIGWNPVATYKRANPRASEAKVQQYIEVNGLYEGFWGYIRGYFSWLWSFVQGPDQWPRSIKGRAEVWPPLRYSMFNTLRLAGISTIIGISIGLLTGIIASLRPGGIVDGVINTSAFVVGSIQPFVSAVVLQLIFAVQLGWLPPAGVYPPGQDGFDLWLMTQHLILPVTVVAIQIIAGYARYMRASILDVRSSDYLRTARAKGISEFRVLTRHSVRNALVPVVTLLGLDLGTILGGLIITEAIFEYPGMGVFFLRAAGNGDFPQLMPYMVIIIVSVLMFNLIADLTYAVLDPRIRLD